MNDDIRVIVHKAEVLDHNNANALEIIKIGDYQSCVRLGDFKNGDHVAYIPENSILPDPLIEEMDLTGKLSGKDKNRVKAVKLRGTLSQGLIYKIDRPLGENVAEMLGITKYVPPTPQGFEGKMEKMVGGQFKFRIYDIKEYPDILKEGESVIITEKLHGTWCLIGYHGHTPTITSKGMAHKSLQFIYDDMNDKNIYVKEFIKQRTSIDAIRPPDAREFYILGEIYGKGIQDLKYGIETPEFRVFDIYIDGTYLSYSEIRETLAGRIPEVPLLFEGNFNKTCLSFTDGFSSICQDHTREGIVIKSDPVRYDDEIGRVMLKNRSEKYLLRHGGTEYN